MSSSVQIIPYYSHPHVHTVITDNTWYDETVAEPRNSQDLPFATAICAGADQGIDNTWVRLSDIRTKHALFGKGNFSKYGQPSLQVDQLFNGQTNVWFLRPLPDNATYANAIILAHFREGKILDELSQETGKVRMDVKFSVAYASKPALTEGAKTADDIGEFARSLTKLTPDAQTGYMVVPVAYINSTGRGVYGNNYSLKINRDIESEKDYDMKMYRFSLLTNANQTIVSNIFSGSLSQTMRYDLSTLIDDVMDQHTLGSSPIRILSFEENFEKLFDFYQSEIVTKNAAYLEESGGSTEDIQELSYAANITVDTFDPIFGVKLNSRSEEEIPYYRNYTVKPTGPWVEPDLIVPNQLGAVKPVNISEWTLAEVDNRVLVLADPLNGGVRWEYKVVSIDETTGDITYNEGISIDIDVDQYTGIDLSLPVGHRLDGGHDGDFQSINVGGVERKPNNTEMKLLLSKEYVKAFRGEKDRKILSPSRVNIDFIYDANYNLTTDEDIHLDNYTGYLYNNSTVLTDKDNQYLATLGGSSFVGDFQDINVKKAIYDLNEFRCRNGMTIHNEEGAGTLLHLDCNFCGLKTIGVNSELRDIIAMMEPFDGRNTSIDLGYYDIFDPVTGKRVSVTATYFIASQLVTHIMSYGLNKPFVSNFATIRAKQANSTTQAATGNMIRDSFYPDIDLIDYDVKEELFKSRINYWLTGDEGRTVQRACQNTRQRDASALLEENNVRVLNSLNKNLEKAGRNYIYEWNEPEVRRGYTESQMEIYRPWIGTMVQDLTIEFTTNEWEEGRMIMRCECSVKFRNIIKRITLHINIQRPEYNTDTGGE